MEEMQAVDREVVSIGLDFRPIPVNVGDGTIWEFTPDPDKAQWQAVTDTLKALKKYQDVAEDDIDITEMTDLLIKTVSGLLVSEEQQKAWRKKGYGLIGQQRVARALIEQWTGFPTQPPSPSGKGSKRTG